MDKWRPKSELGGDAFFCALACVAGVLVALLLLSAVMAGQLKVFMLTPMEQSTRKASVFIECRNNELFEVPVADLRRQVSDVMEQIRVRAGGAGDSMLKELMRAQVGNDAYRVDLTYALMGQFALQPVPTTKGYWLDDEARETPSDWYGRLLTGIDRKREIISFIVRDDSFDVFKRARALARSQGIEVSYELLGVNDPIKFGLGGKRAVVQ